MMEPELLQKAGEPRERLWDYRIGDRVVEAVPESKLKELISSGQLGGEARVRSSGMAGWEMVANIKPLLPGFSKKPRPLIRFLARLSEMTIYGCILAFFMIICSIFYPPIMDAAQYFFASNDLIAVVLGSMFIICSWAIWEPLLISAFGTTPGKWLFNMWVSRSSGGRLSLKESYRRSAKVLVKGMALGIPGLYLLTMFMSYFDFRIYGMSSWDFDGHSVVSHGRIGIIRAVGIITLIAIYLLGPFLFNQ